MADEKPPSYDAYPPQQYPSQQYPPQQYPPQQYPPQQYPPQQYPPQQPYPPQQQYPPQQYPPQQQYPPPVLTQNEPPSYEESGAAKCPDVEAYPGFEDLGVTNFNDKSIRLGFIRKVFAIVALQMAVTIAMTSWFMFHKPTNEYVTQSIGLYVGAYVVFLVLYFVLCCCSRIARKHPINLILLGLFTLSLGYLVAVISAFHDTEIVLAAFGMTIICTSSVVAFASQTKYDVTKCSGVLFCCSISLFLFGIFAGVLVPMGYMRILNVVYAFLGALLFMGYLAFDVQLLMGGKKYELSPEDYVFAAMQLYVDVIYIFLFILQIFSGGK